MFLRISSVKRKNKTYLYAQIVQSYRRSEDGLPAHRVVANLGQLSPLEIENLKRAFQASQANLKTMIARLSPKETSKPIKPQQNLAYLDLAVLLEVWKESGLVALLQDALSKSEARVAQEWIIAILCLHRCQDPGSKLSATRWYETTSLPELTGIPCASFNNTRLHRVLYAVEQINAVIMAKLPALYREKGSDSSAFFLDISDAWFSGNEPSFAKRGLSKDGAIRKKIGIVLLCNKDGFPMRWAVVDGSSNDSGIMIDMLEEIHELAWLQGVPLVCDRAMGRSSLLQKMYDKNVMFLTALSRHEYTNYTGTLSKFMSEIENDGVLSDEQLEQRARQWISENEKFCKVNDNLFTTDLGEVEIMVVGEQSDYGAAKKYKGNRIAEAMHLGQKIKQLLCDGKFDSITAAGASLGLKTGITHNYYSLTRLPQMVQDAILSGRANNCSVTRILEIADKESPEAMLEKFYEHVDASNKGPKRIKRQFSAPCSSSQKETKKIKVRVVAYYNPQMYAEQTTRAARWLKGVNEFVDDLNRRLQSSNSRRTKESVYAEIDRFIRKKDLLRCFEITIEGSNPKQMKSVQLTLNLAEWNRRRQFDGLCVLVAHPQCRLSATAICQLYRGKDVVEKDFQLIKSVLQIRPIRHRSDEKVKAHVTICMLSLLLERILRKKLKGQFTVTEALEALHPCHLNRYRAGDESLYTITEINATQRKILEILHLLPLADDSYLTERLHAR